MIYTSLSKRYFEFTFDITHMRIEPIRAGFAALYNIIFYTPYDSFWRIFRINSCSIEYLNISTGNYLLHQDSGRPATIEFPACADPLISLFPTPMKRFC